MGFELVHILLFLSSVDHSGCGWDVFAESFISSAVLVTVDCSRILGKVDLVAWVSALNDSLELLLQVILSETDLRKHSVSPVVPSQHFFHQIWKNLFYFSVWHRRNLNKKFSLGNTEIWQETSSRRGLTTVLSGHPFERDVEFMVLLECRFHGVWDYPREVCFLFATLWLLLLKCELTDIGKLIS